MTSQEVYDLGVVVGKLDRVITTLDDLHARMERIEHDHSKLVGVMLTVSTVAAAVVSWVSTNLLIPLKITSA